MGDQSDRASAAVAALLEAVYAWQEKADALVTTGAFEDEVVATHDSRGCLIELWVRPGLQQELTTEELEDALNDAISDNAHRAHAAMEGLAEEFLRGFEAIPEEYLDHPVAEQLARVYHCAREPKSIEGST